MDPPPSKRLRTDFKPDDRSAATAVQLAELLQTPAGLECAAADGAAPRNTLLRLESVERVFCSQTLAATPAPPAGDGNSRESEGTFEDGFKISYSQTYLRCEGQAQAQASTTEEVEDPWAGLAAERAGGEAARRGVRSRAERQSTTPELVHAHTDAPPGSVTGATLTSPRLFPIFRPKSQWKTLYIVRHGESEYNAAVNLTRDFRDPQIFDPQLTAKGRAQAAKLAGQLKVPEGALWVVSPLTRAVQTFYLARRRPEPAHSRDHYLSTAVSLPAKVVVRPELAEHMMTTGDIGLPASTLLRRFPLLREAAMELPERWWFAPHANDAEAKRFQRPESKKDMQERVRRFRRWAQACPEQVIVAIGHSCMFRELSGGRHMRNCEVVTMQI